MPYPDHVRRRREAIEVREAHLREGPADCRCLDHVGVGALRRELEARRKIDAERIGEPPF